MEAFKNSYKVEEKSLVSLSVYNVGYQHCEPLFQWGPGTRDHYLIHYIVTGRGFYSVNDEIFPLSAGDAFLVYPDTNVTYYAHEKEPWEYYWVGFSGSDAPSLLEATDFSKSSPVIRGFGDNPSDNTLKKHIFRIYQSRGSSYANAVKMSGELYLMLAELIMAAEKPDIKAYDYSYVQKAIDYIAANYSYPITVDSIADYVGISRSQLFREFKKYLDLSPKEYLTNYRIKRACHLLKTTSLSITSIAYSIGYDNSMYFSKVFRREKGMTPTDYLRKHR